MRYILLLTLIAGTLFTNAQTVDINPDVQWRYLKSQDLELQKGSAYKYDFPGERGYDYVFSLSFPTVALKTFIKVYDFQMKPIASMVDSSAGKITNLTFRVPADGTYYVVLGYDSEEEEDAMLTSKFTLIRRQTVY